MKKLLCFCMALICVLSAFGCDKGGSGDADTTQSTTVLGPGATAADLVDSDLAEKIGVTSDKYEIDGAMVAFFLYDSFNRFVSENYFYLSSYGLDPNKSLKEQPFNYGKEETWFDYFLGSAKQQITEIIALISGLEDPTVTEEIRNEVEAYLQRVREYAEENDFPSVEHYYASIYASGVTEAVARRCIELNYLANQAYTELYDSFQFSAADYEAYRKENPAGFYLFDYIYYPIYAEYDKEATEEEIKAAYEVAKQEGNALAEKLRGEGKEALLAYMMTAEDCDRATAETRLKSTYTVEDDYIRENAAFLNWALDASRQIGDIGVAWDEDYEVCTVYLLNSTGSAEPLSYVTKNVRHILFKPDTYGSKEAAKAEAERVLALYQNGAKTEESFGLLAKEHSEDGSSVIGGLYEEVPLGKMVTPFEDWIYEEGRQTGDVGMIETTYGYHLMYFVGDGRILWHITADEAVRSQALEVAFEELLDAHKVTFHDEVLKEIP